MESLDQTCASLRAQIRATESQLAGLKRELQQAEQAVSTATTTETKADDTATSVDSGSHTEKTGHKQRWPLLNEEYRRYGRQMIVEQIGLKGQLKLRCARVLIVGAGGLGCPAAQYLAGAGVGTIGLVDGDAVDTSNLHRQVLHHTVNIGMLKVDSAIEYLKRLNPHSKYIPHRNHLTPQEAPEIFSNYDIVLDCTDNPATRYLISDTAVVLGKPLVSASALRTEGQLMVLNNPPRPPGDNTGGPCYRCVFPRPPPANSVTSCADGGILGPVVGTMGVLQALETIKVITSLPREGIEDGSHEKVPETSPSFLIFSAYSTPPFRSIRLRSRRANCAVCSATANVTVDTITSGSTDYVFFCGTTSPTPFLSPEERVSPSAYIHKHQPAPPNNRPTAATPDNDKPPTIIDVREKVQYDICHLDNSINIPISRILSTPAPANEHEAQPLPPWLPTDSITPDSTDPIYVVCRLGNDSQVAVRRFKELGLDRGGERFVGDIRGGLSAWKREVDPEWPEY